MKALNRPPALAFPEMEKDEASAVKALGRGDAGADQQRKALDWILKKVCQIGGVSFDPDPHIAAFNEGKRFVGLQILYVLNEPMTAFEKPKPRRTK